MKRISRHELRQLEKELESLETRAKELSEMDSPDELTLNWVEARTQQIKDLLNVESKKANFTERGLRLLS